MKLWQKENTSIDHAIEAFTVGQDRELDLHLAAYDVLGSLAHGQMLARIGLLTNDEFEALRPELIRIYQQIEAGKFVIEEGVEDVHSQVELMLTQRLGDTGKKIHSGRSRNDQVLLDLRLFLRHELQEITELTQTLFDSLQTLSEQHKNVLLPGYTHTQVAMPSSFGLWLGAYAESLTDDAQLLAAAYKVTNQNPLGSAAGYGSSFPLDRTLTTQLLGFDTLSYNVVYAQMGRGKVEKTVSFALSSVAATLGKLAADICLYMSQNFGFVSFPDQLTTGSSIMPHKKNPDVFELVRAHCNKLIALPNEISLVIGNLTSGYHRDLQILKESLFPALNQTKQCLRIMHYALGHLRVNERILDDEKYRYLSSVEVVNREVMNGLPFRDAYRTVGQQIADNTFAPVKEFNHTHEGSLGNLCTEQIAAKMKQVLTSFDFDKAERAIQQLMTS
ncbi:MAG: argininosuccinate lyase [Tunicatimonas sp.]